MDSEFDHHAVLLVEDNADDALLMQSAWRAAGMRNQMPIVYDGEQALAYLNGNGVYANRERFPIPISVFLDLKLPRIDGLDVLAAIRRTPELRQLNVDVLSASARGADVEKALALGANSYLVKPSRVEGLVEMLRAWHALAKFKMFVVPTVLETS
jgi:CheY-like chemotaxis protein